MTKTTQLVWEIINNEPIIKKGMYLGLINHRALARYLQEKAGIDAPLDSIISAIRRFEVTDKFTDQYEGIPRLLKGSDVSSKNNLVLVTLKNDVNLYKEFKTLFDQIDNINRQKFRQIIVEDLVKVIADKKDLSIIEKVFKRRIIKINRNLGEVKIVINPNVQSIKGIAAKISNEIAEEEVNIKEIITCLPDFLVYVEEKDLAKAHETLMKLCL